MPPCADCTNPTLCTDRCQVYAEQLRACEASGQMDSRQVSAHVEAGEMPARRANVSEIDARLLSSWKFYRSRPMTDEEQRAARMLEPVSAPLGLADWRTTEGVVYGKGANAVSAQVGINKRTAAPKGEAGEMTLRKCDATGSACRSYCSTGECWMKAKARAAPKGEAREMEAAKGDGK